MEGDHRDTEPIDSGYDQVKLEILWSIVSNDLPPLVSEFQKIVDEVEKQQKLF